MTQRFQLTGLAPAAVDGLNRAWYFEMSEKNRKQYDDIKASIESQVARERKSDDALEQLSRRVCDLEKARTADKCQIKMLQGEIKVLGEHLDAFIANLKNQVELLETELSDLDKVRTKSQAQIDRLTTEAKAARDRFDSIVRDLKSQAEEHAQAKARLQALEIEKRAASQNVPLFHLPSVPGQQPAQQFTPSTTPIQHEIEVPTTTATSANLQTDGCASIGDYLAKHSSTWVPRLDISQQLLPVNLAQSQTDTTKDPASRNTSNENRSMGSFVVPSLENPLAHGNASSARQNTALNNLSSLSLPPSRNLRSRKQKYPIPVHPPPANFDADDAVSISKAALKHDRRPAAVSEEPSKPARKRARTIKEKPVESSQNVSLPSRPRFVQGNSTNRQYITMASDRATSLGEDKKEIEKFIADFIRGLANVDERKRLEIKLRERHPTRTHPEGYVVVERCKWTQLLTTLRIVKIL